MKRLALLAVMVTGAMLIYAVDDFPQWGDPNSPASQHLSPYYIQNAEKDAAAPNMVTVVLADYRGFDTLFETAVIFTAGLAILALLYKPGTKETRLLRAPAPPGSPIIITSCRLLIPIIQLFGLYVLAHGHHSPGGGFQGGVILAASLILMALAYDLKTVLKRFSERLLVILAAVGVLLYAGIGVLCLIFGRNFLDYGVLSKILFVSEPYARSHSILGVETGVALAVTSIMLLIYFLLSSNGHLEEGI